MNTWTESENGIPGMSRAERQGWVEPLQFVERCLDVVLDEYELTEDQRQRFGLMKLEMATRRRRLLRKR